VTTAYLASACSRNRVVTLEGSEAVLRVAQGVWKALRLENIAWQEGNIDDTLYIYAREKLDLVYLDANHTYDATMRYAAFLLPRLTEKGVLVIDDIHYSKEMERAWLALRDDPRVTTSMDLYHCGLLFVDPHYLKRNYRIRI
jgi:predicted O-methyltransferase YrrM